MVLTLSDLKPRVVDVSIIVGKLPPVEAGGLPVDHVVTVPLRVPSWIEWMEMGLEVAAPERDKVEDYSTGKKKLIDESGPVWESKVNEANNRRMIRRLAFSLIEAGNFPELKDADADEQIKAIGSMDAGILQALVKTLNTLVQFTAGRIEDTSARFRSATVSQNGNANLLPEPVDAGSME